jgi:hypothetical protein
LMSLRPSDGDAQLTIVGQFEFSASRCELPDVTECYNLRIIIPNSFPQDAAKVYELDGRIPKDGDFHVNPDGSLCLGSPLRVLLGINSYLPLESFVKNNLVPYLYAVSLKLNNGGQFFMGELDHGEKGVVSDYMELLNVDSASSVKKALTLTSMKKRIANKKPCPCNCGKRLGKCKLRFTINKLRKRAPRAWFSKHISNLNSQM